MSKTRPPAVAGTFYPSDPSVLSEMVSKLLGAVSDDHEPGASAIIAPHAGFVFSGQTAGVAFNQFRGASAKRVLIIGPSHFVSFNGLALSTHSRFSTPLGEVPVDQVAVETLSKLDFVTRREDAHVREHSIETHLPFLQTVLDNFSIVPVVVGAASDEQIARVIEACWDAESLISVSSDLSHFLTHSTAKEADADTARRIEEGEYETLDGRDACGFRPIRGLMNLVQDRGMKFETLDLRNSGDVTGDRDRVVGYGAFALRKADE